MWLMLIGGVTVVAIIVLSTLFYFGLLIDVHILKKAKASQIKVACVGDSITYGFGVSNWPQNSYPALLNEKLGSSFCVNNYGYSSRTLVKECALGYTKENLYQKSLNFKPNIVVIMLGTNDSYPQNWQSNQVFYDNYNQLIDSYLKLGSVQKIVLLTPIPINDDSPQGVTMQETITNNIIPIIKQICKEKSLTCVDCFENFKDNDKIFRDNLHLNKIGTDLLAQKVYEQIKG